MMGLHKITAGSGYTYLTSQTATLDSTRASGQDIADYYSEKGEKPGVWMGAGLPGLGTIEAGSRVREDQMVNLFGEGRHPDADAIEAALVTGGADAKDVRQAVKLGQAFGEYDEKKSAFQVAVAQEFQTWLRENGRRSNDAVPEDVRAEIRTRVGRETFANKFGREPSERELNAHIARSTRPKRQAVAGYDLTFSPVKSVSVLWALSNQATAEVVAAAHDAAVKDAFEWIEREAAFTRTGRNGIKHEDTNGLVAAAFVHRDSRAGDPDLHTHVAVSNKVQDAATGKWYALDGTVLHKAAVAASERYNTALERELNERLGVTFANHVTSRNARPVREIAGIPTQWIDAFSSRRAQIEAETSALQTAFRRKHGRAPTPKESLALYQEATLSTRAKKHEPRSEAEQRAAWREAALALAGGDIDAVDTRLQQIVSNPVRRVRTLTEEQVNDLAGMVRHTVHTTRARFQIDHVLAETQRRVRAIGLDPSVEQDTVSRVVANAMNASNVVSLEATDPVSEPDFMRRRDGSSVYERPRASLFTTTQMLAAEQAIVDAAKAKTSHVAPQVAVSVALLEAVANGRKLNDGQRAMITGMATSGARVQLALAPAGSGKTTAMRALATAWNTSHPITENGGGVVALAPTAAAARELGDSLQADAETIAKLIHTLDDPAGEEPQWMRRIGAGTLLIVDEAGMAATRDLARLVEFASARDAVVRLVGDDQQLAAVSAGGVLRDIAHEVGALTLDDLVRFSSAAEADASLAMRQGDTSALGFLLDNDRVRVTSEGDLEAQVYAAWKSATDDGHEALMLAVSNDTVTDLNQRAQADRVAAGRVTLESGAHLHTGARAGVGDVIVTRRNERRLPLSPTDFVKNGDRWDVLAVHEDGSLTARHHGLGSHVTLPAEYVRESVTLGYASTIHGAQGQTVHSSFLLARGEETRQAFYVAMSRGTDLNAVYLPAGTSGDEHEQLHQDRIMPKAATEILEGILARDGAEVSALTEQRTANDPDRLLCEAANRYLDALVTSSLRHVGDDVLEALEEEAERLVPGLSTEPAWEALVGRIVLVAANGLDPFETLREAVAERALGDARDKAAVLSYRLDRHGAMLGRGPLPWMPAIPCALRDDETVGPWLRERASLTRRRARTVATLARQFTDETAPEWARHIYARDRNLTADVAVWRAVNDVPDSDTSLTGPDHPALRERTYQRQLQERYTYRVGRSGAPGVAFTPYLNEHAPHVLEDPFWSVLGTRLDEALDRGIPVRDLLVQALALRPLPDEHAAAALWSRLVADLEPETKHTHSDGLQVRPRWAGAFTRALGQDRARVVMAEPGWVRFVEAVRETSYTTGLSAEDVAAAAVAITSTEELNAGELAAALTARARDMASADAPAVEDVHEVDVLDADMDAFLAQLAAERDATMITDVEVEGDVPDDVEEYAPVEDLEPPLDLEDLPPDPQEEPPAPQPQPAPESPDARLRALTVAAGEFYARQYDGSPSQAYLRDRFGTDLTDTPYLVGHAGHASDALVKHLRATMNATDTELVDAGLARHSQYGNHALRDYFRDRALIGVHDESGELIGFNGRDLTGRSSAKYLNTPATAIFTKGSTLFGLTEGRGAASTERPDVVGVEGPMDAIAVTLAGKGRVIGVAGGTGGFTHHQVSRLADYARTTNGGTIWLAKDNDRAGRAALVKDTAAFQAVGITAQSLEITGGKDIADMWQDTPDVLEASLRVRDHSPLAARFVVMNTAKEADLEHADIPTRAYVLDKISANIASLPPQYWEAEIDHAIGLFAERDNTADYAHYARTLHDAITRHANEWHTDHGPHTPAPTPEATAPGHLHGVLREHATREAQPGATQILDDLEAEKAASEHRTQQQQRSTRKTSEAGIRPDDDMRGPTHSGPSAGPRL